jgi:HJR/Mrr/RecB family endonuclease
VEEALVRESISLTPKQFNDFSGSDFENLLYRMFVAMGYAVQKIGKVGDQGGDLVANVSGQRILIQAKRYTGAVGNGAVQEAVAAQRFYDCNRAMVVTNSSFTREAIELAKVDDVELVGGGKLSEMLLQYLKESWS